MERALSHRRSLAQCALRRTGLWLLLLLPAMLAAAAAVPASDAPSASAPDATPGGTPLSLERRAHGLPLRAHMELLHDPRAELNIDTLRDPTFAADWQPLTRAPRLGGKRTVWLRARVEQPDEHGHWLLAMSTTALSDVTLYGPYDVEGRMVTPAQRTGLQYPYDSRPLGLERMAFLVDLREPGVYEILLRVRSDFVRVNPPHIWHPADFFGDRRHKAIFDGICYGILGTLLVYNLVLAGAFRSQAYVWYVVACTSALLTLSTYNGHAAHYLWPEQPWLIEYSYALFPSLWITSNAMFARSFLNLAQHTLIMDRLVLLLGAIPLLGIGLALGGAPALTQQINETLAIVGAVLMTAAALLLWRRGLSDALWYLAAQAVLFIAVIAVVMIAWGVVDAPFLLANALQIGVAGEMIALAMALSARIRRVQNEQVALRARTAELARAAATDPLTGLANRSGLAQGAHHLLREDNSCALLLVDLNQFKAINDVHGHEAGDHVLCTAAQRLKTQFRDTDVVARTGGDEFVVLLAQRPPRATLELTLLRVAEALQQPISFGDLTLSISASIGVAGYPEQGHSLDALMRHADQAMYGAKRDGGGHRMASALPV